MSAHLSVSAQVEPALASSSVSEYRRVHRDDTKTRVKMGWRKKGDVCDTAASEQYHDFSARGSSRQTGLGTLLYLSDRSNLDVLARNEYNFGRRNVCSLVTN